METNIFCLIPFYKIACKKISVQVEIGRKNGRLSLIYTISGSTSDILLPKATVVMQRRDRLWEETCLELFIAPKGSLYYWEFNLSPAGHWNVYRFESYRKYIREESAFKSMPFKVELNMDSLKAALNISLDRIVSKNQVLEISACAVTRQHDNTMNYWALVHSGGMPDFHLRESFIIQL